MQVTLKDYLDKIKAEILTPEVDITSVSITNGYVSDMLSDVMGTAKEGQVWITIMRHMNTVAVASMTNIPCVVFAKGLRPDAAVIERALQEEVCLAVSDLQVFDLAGILYRMLDKQ
jgi:serine kinase of HPr protein (carbohydrate metabolism regulator)